MEGKQFSTEVLDLPSQGWFYPPDNPLSKGTIEIKYMGAKEEDILTSTNLVKRGVAIDMVLRSVIVSPINYDDLLIGDKNAVMIATRVLGYGKEYDVEITCPNCGLKQRRIIDLSAIQHKEVNLEKHTKGVNEFEYVLPNSGTKLTFRFLTSKDEREIDDEIKQMKKVNPNYNAELSSRLKRLIVAVDGKRDAKTITAFVDSQLKSVDSLALRKYLNEIQPGVDMNFDFECSNSDCGYDEKMMLPMTVEFFWPGGQR